MTTTAAAPATGFRGRHILSISQFDREDLEVLFRTADEIQVAAEEGLLGSPLAGQVLVSAFFDTSTRTRLAHESAMIRLGGGVLGFADAGVTRASGAQPERSLDVFRMLSRYGDVIVTRHPVTGVPEEAAAAVRHALVVNAGDGTGEHPTQTFTDLYTLWQRFHRIDGLKVAVLNDLRMRCVRSLLRALRLFDVDVYQVPGQGMAMPRELAEENERGGQPVRALGGLRETLAEVDAVYSSPTVLDEPWTDEPGADGDTPLTADLLAGHAQPDLAVLHPLPRKEELHPSVDDTRFNGYWAQAGNGVLARMAMLKLMLDRT